MTEKWLQELFRELCCDLDAQLNTLLLGMFSVSQEREGFSEAHCRYTAKTLLGLAAFMYAQGWMQYSVPAEQGELYPPAPVFSLLAELGYPVDCTEDETQQQEEASPLSVRRELKEIWNRLLSSMEALRLTDGHSATRFVLDMLQERAIARGQTMVTPLLPSGVVQLMLALAQPSPEGCFLDLYPGLGGLPAEALLESEQKPVQLCVRAGSFAALLLQCCGLPCNFLSPSDSSPVDQDKAARISAVQADVACSMGAALNVSAGDRKHQIEEVSLLQQHLACLRPRQGHAVLLVSPPLLFRQEYAAIFRNDIVQRNILDAVLLLPSNALYGHNEQFALLLFDLRREKGGACDTKNDVFMLDLDAVALEKQENFWRQSKNLNYFEVQHVQRVRELMRKREEIRGMSCCVPCKRLLAEGVWLPSRFLYDPEHYNWRLDEGEYLKLKRSLTSISGELESQLHSLEHDFLKIEKR